MRFARKVDFTIRNGQEKEFNRIFESEVLGMLKKQKGFQDEFVLTNGHRATAISLWDTKANAEAYAKAGYMTVIDALKPAIEGSPKVENCDVTCSTLHASV